MKKILYPSLIILGLFGFNVSSPAFADNHKNKACGEKSKQCPYMKGHHHTDFHGNFFLDFKDDLALTEKQSTQLSSIAQAFKARKSELKKEKMALKKALNEVSHGEKYDAKAIAKLTQKIGQVKGHMMENKLVKLHEASDVLTDEQSKKVWEMATSKQPECKADHQGKNSKKKGKKGKYGAKKQK